MDHKEINGFIGLPQYEAIIARIVNEIISTGCKIMPQEPYQWRSSYVSYDGVSRLKIYFGKKHPDSDMVLRILWDMFHEYGHFLSDQVTEQPVGKEQERREILAWKKGYYKAKEYFGSQELEEYKCYGNRCLKTYNIIEIKPDDWLKD